MKGVTGRPPGAFAALGVALRNRSLRAAELAYASAITADWAFVVALGVFAYQAGGALAVGVVGLVRMLPAAAATPFVALLGDRYRRERLLLAVALASACILAGAPVAFFLGRSQLLIYALAALHAVVFTVFRPALAALLPSLATTPEELIASNGLSSTAESLGTLAGPALAGLLVATTDAGVAFAAAAGACLLAALLLAGVRVEGLFRPGRARPARRIAHELAEGFRVVATSPHPRLVVALFGAQTLVRGALSVLIVVTAFRLFHSGGGWVGVLTAALGAGGLVGAFASLALTGRRLAIPFGLGLVLWGAPIALVAAWPRHVPALLLLAVVGAGNSLEDVAGYSLLQRIVRDEVLTRVLGVLRGLAMAGAGLGSIVAPALVAGLGARGALVTTGCFLPLIVVPAWRRLAAIDLVALPPARELAVMRGVPLFAPLSVAAKEQLAASLIPLAAPAGTAIIAEGDVGDRFYVVEQGRAEVTKDGRSVEIHGPGGYFGEIALLRGVPRTATVTALEDVQLYAIERDDFVAAVTGHPAVREAGDAVVDERLARLAANRMTL